MATYAPNVTPRYKLHYTTQGKAHTALWRIQRGTVFDTTFLGKVHDFYAAMAPVLFSDWTMVSAEQANEDSDVFLPSPLPTAITGSVSVGGASASDAAFAAGFIGRSSGGQKARMFLYGVGLAALVRNPVGNDWRLSGVEESHVAAAVNVLNFTLPVLFATDDHDVLWYNYASIKYNDRWVRKLRRG